MDLRAAAGLALLAGVALATSAAAEEPKTVPGAAALSAAQAADARRNAQAARRLFSRIDRNGDGLITPAEWSSWHDAEFAAAIAGGEGTGPAAD